MWKLTEKARNSKWGISIRTPWEYYEHDPCNMVNISLFGWSFWWKTPEYIKPKKVWKEVNKDDAYWKARGGGYWDYIQRCYGFTTFDNAIHISYGIQPGEWRSNDPENSDHVKVWNYPWREMDMVRYEKFSLDGKRKWNANRKSFMTDDESEWGKEHDKVYQIKDREEAWKYEPFPGVYQFLMYVDPYDGEVVPAKYHVEEREWRVGNKRPWTWLRLFRRPFIRRCLEIEFFSETGSRKGSWKGGTMGTGINVLPGEAPEMAWLRFCTEECNKVKKERHRG